MHDLRRRWQSLWTISLVAEDSKSAFDFSRFFSSEQSELIRYAFVSALVMEIAGSLFGLYLAKLLIHWYLEFGNHGYGPWFPERLAMRPVPALIWLLAAPTQPALIAAGSCGLVPG